MIPGFFNITQGGFGILGSLHKGTSSLVVEVTVVDVPGVMLLNQCNSASKVVASRDLPKHRRREGDENGIMRSRLRQKKAVFWARSAKIYL